MRLASSFMLQFPTTTKSQVIGSMLPKVQSCGKSNILLQASFETAPNSEMMELVDEWRHDADVIFSIMDADGSGSLSRDEMALHLSESNGYTADMISKIFNAMDDDRNDSISKREFQSGFLRMASLRNAPGLLGASCSAELIEDANRIFQSLDTDDNGFIDLLEWKNHFTKLGRFTERAIDNIFNKLAGSNTLSQSQFRFAFLHYSALRQAIGES